jgi:hypothetical protein
MITLTIKNLATMSPEQVGRVCALCKDGITVEILAPGILFSFDNQYKLHELWQRLSESIESTND